MLPLRLLRAAVAAPLFAVVAFQGAAQAQLVDPSDRSASLGVGLKRQVPGGVETAAGAMPWWGQDDPVVRFAVPVMDLRLPAGGAVALGLRMRATFDDRHLVGDAALRPATGERNSGLWLGAAALWRSGAGDLSAEWLADASGRSAGQRLRLMVERPVSTGALQVAPRLALHWHDRRSAHYHFGARGAGEGNGRAGDGGALLNTEVGLRTSYALTASQGLYLDLSAMRLGSGIQDSPWIDRAAETAVRLGYLYRF